MKIYQIHKYGGHWEDRYDYIVGSYLSEAKAIKEKEQLEQEEKIKRKCNSCPLYFCEDDCIGDCEDCEECNNYRIDKAKKYCDRYESFDKNKHNPEEYYENDQCVNFWLEDESCFRIEDVEVIE